MITLFFGEIRRVLFSGFFMLSSTISWGQSPSVHDQVNDTGRRDHGVRIMFYNVENLFDTFDDPATEDDEYTPESEKGWTNYRYKQKLNNIGKTIIAVGGWEPPAIVGLCEVENFQVLLDLTTGTPLKNFGYRIIHENSGDRRGIDNALLYLPNKVRPISHQSITISKQEDFNTRDILYVRLVIMETDTVHFFVNHWPSRVGGKEFTEKKRMVAARVLKSFTDSLLVPGPAAKIFIMGDFNDEPADRSLSEGLSAKELKNGFGKNQLYNLSYGDFRARKGTLVYKEIDHTWFLFDQMIVSTALLMGNGLVTKGLKNHIFTSEWLLKDGRPYRMYQGPIYKGGFSDHLPIFIDLYIKQ